MKHRQSKKFFGQIFRHWEDNRPIAKALAGWLKMDRNGIVHPASDFLFRQISTNFVALLHSDRINVIYMPRVIRLKGSGNAVDSSESVVVLQRVFAPQEISFFEIA